MQALIIGSRSINQDHFLQKQAQDKYSKHLNSIKSIATDRNNNLQDWQSQVENMASTLRKSKSAAKLFRDKEQKSQMRTQNMFLLKKIWHLEPTLKTFHEDRYQHISGSNKPLQKKKLSEIKEENKRHEKKLLVQQYVEKNEYKKKLRQDIQQYVELRDSIRKFKLRDTKPKRSQSERKVSVGLKLKKIDSQQNINKQVVNQPNLGEESPEIEQSKEIRLI